MSLAQYPLMPAGNQERTTDLKILRQAAPSLQRRRTLSRMEVVAARRESAIAHRNTQRAPRAESEPRKLAEVYDPSEKEPQQEPVNWLRRVWLLMAGTAVMFAFGGIAARVVNHL